MTIFPIILITLFSYTIFNPAKFSQFVVPLFVLVFFQDLACSGCLLSGLSQTALAAYDLAFSGAIYTALGMNQFGGSVNVTGATQKTTTRRQLLTPTVTLAYTVRMNNPAVTAAVITTALTSATTLSTVGTVMTAATGSTVTATTPALTTVTVAGGPSPTASPSSKSAASSFQGPSLYSFHAISVIIGSVGMMLLLPSVM